MQHISLKDPNQHEFTKLEDLIEQDIVVRFEGVFVDKLELPKLVFTINAIISVLADKGYYYAKEIEIC